MKQTYGEYMDRECSKELVVVTKPDYFCSSSSQFYYRDARPNEFYCPACETAIVHLHASSRVRHSPPP